MRGGILAASTQGTVLIEAATRSQFRSIVDYALGLGRPVVAFPGSVHSPMSAGCHELLRRITGVRLVTNADEIFEEVAGLTPRSKGPEDTGPVAA